MLFRSTIPITVLRCDYSNNKHLSYLFTVFHRLNSTGLKLNNQEIRNCIFAGPLNRLLRELDDNPDWRRLNKMKKGEYYRLQKQELILRFFAFQESLDVYTGSLASFLNTYMEKNRFMSNDDINRYRVHFCETVRLLGAGIEACGHKGKISITLQDALCYAVGKTLGQLQTLPPQTIGMRVQAVINDPNFSEASLAEGLAKKERLKERMRTAEALFK